MRNPLLNALNERLLALLLVISVLSALFGCENSNLDDDQIEKIDFEIVILDDGQIEATNFATGEDVRIALKIINNAEQPLAWRHDYTCLLFQTDDFLLVRKRNGGNDTHANYLPLGIPYQSPVNCATINLPPDVIAPGETVLINLPWSSNIINTPLITGQYYTTADFELNINNKRKRWSLRTDFVLN